VNIDAYDDRLSMVGSEGRAGVLLDVVRAAEPDVGNALLAYWFTICDALKPWAAGLREEFRRCGYVTDDKRRKQFKRTRQVYRGGWHDDAEETAISWTTSRETAEFFCRYLTGPRSWFLGIRRDDSIPVVFTGTVEPDQCLARFNGREEKEVIVGRIDDREILSGLMTPDQIEAYNETGVEPWHLM
jgi:hypothetical protein